MYKVYTGFSKLKEGGLPPSFPSYFCLTKMTKTFSLEQFLTKTIVKNSPHSVSPKEQKTFSKKYPAIHVELAYNTFLNDHSAEIDALIDSKETIDIQTFARLMTQDQAYNLLVNLGNDRFWSVWARLPETSITNFIDQSPVADLAGWVCDGPDECLRLISSTNMTYLYSKLISSHYWKSIGELILSDCEIPYSLFCNGSVVPPAASRCLPLLPKEVLFKFLMCATPTARRQTISGLSSDTLRILATGGVSFQNVIKSDDDLINSIVIASHAPHDEAHRWLGKAFLNHLVERLNSGPLNTCDAQKLNWLNKQQVYEIIKEKPPQIKLMVVLFLNRRMQSEIFYELKNELIPKDSHIPIIEKPILRAAIEKTELSYRYPELIFERAIVSAAEDFGSFLEKDIGTFCAAALIFQASSGKQFPLLTPDSDYDVRKNGS